MMAYGYKVEKEGDKFVSTVDEAMDKFAISTSAGAFLANIFPARASSSLPHLSCFVLILNRGDIHSHPHPLLVPRCRLQEDGGRMARNT